MLPLPTVNPVLTRFVYLSTAEVFGPAPNGVTHKEYDRYNSGNPYAAAKVGCHPHILIYKAASVSVLRSVSPKVELTKSGTNGLKEFDKE